MSTQPAKGKRSCKEPATDDPALPLSSREPPQNCPLFPGLPTRAVGKVVLQRIESDDEGEDVRVFVSHKRVNAEMDVDDIAAIAGGGSYEIFAYNRETGKLAGRREIEIDGPPKGLDDYDDANGEVQVVTGSDGSKIIIPPGLKGPAIAAHIAQEQRIADAKRAAEGGGTMGTVLSGMFGMMGTMMAGGGNNNAAMDAMRAALDAANREKITMMTQHGDALRELREQHAKAMDASRADLSSERAEVRRLTLLMETKIAEAVREAHAKHDADVSKLRSEVNRLESALLGRDREIVRLQGAANSASETVELARLFAPKLDGLVAGLSGNGLPPDLQKTVDAIQKEILPTVRRLNAHPLLSGGGGEPPAVDPAPAQPAAATPQPAASNGPSVPTPAMLG